MAAKLLTPDAALEVLSATPVRIAAAIEGLQPVQLHIPPSEGEWSANQVLAHLRACADVRGGAIPRILDEERPRIRTTDPRSYLLTTDYLDLGFVHSFEAFSQQRSELLRLLQSLPAEGWTRHAIIFGAGAPKEWSIHFYADWVARHERPHVKQIEAIAISLRS